MFETPCRILFKGEKSKAEYTYVTIEDLRKRAVSTKAPDFSALGNVKVIDRTGPQAKYLHGMCVLVAFLNIQTCRNFVLEHFNCLIKV